MTLFMGAGPSCWECHHHRSPPIVWWRRWLGLTSVFDQPYSWLKQGWCRRLDVYSNDERLVLNRDGKCGPLGKLFTRKA